MFGLVNVDSVEIKYPQKALTSRYADTFPMGNHSTSIFEGVGMFLFALYHVSVNIVLVNMLIAMMSHSFEMIQVGLEAICQFACQSVCLVCQSVSLSVCLQSVSMSVSLSTKMNKINK